jgi:hypothetical protein
MLWEYWQYLTTPCESRLKEMGYLTELISIQSRASRLMKDWTPHLERTKKIVREGIEKCKGRDIALVCGSGWLLDVPLKELAESFRRVILLDMVHPRSVRRNVRNKFPNVELVTCDLSGVAFQVYDYAHSTRNSPRRLTHPQPSSKVLEKFAHADFVCSVNVLSQLPIIPCEFIANNPSAKQLDAQHVFAKTIQTFHFDWIKRFPHWVLMTDVESMTFDREGKELEKKWLVEIMEKLSIKEEWTWDLAPFGEEYSSHRTVRRVVACGS